jgi:putative peptidoglycan lipid II flippase
MVENQLTGALGSALIGTVALVVYVGILGLLRVPELTTAWQTVRRLVARR